MSLAFSTLMRHVQNSFPDAIKIPDGITKERGKLSTFLGSFFSSFYIEWHCAQPERSDLLCSLTYENRLQVRDRIPSFKKDGLTKETWATLAVFLDQWEHIQHRLAGSLPHIWLAFDYNITSESYDPPNIHFCIDKHFTSRNLKTGYVNTLSAKRFSTMVRTVGNLISCAHTTSVFSHLADYYQSILSSGGEVLHLSLMHSRTPAWAKLNFTIPAIELPVLLKSFGWPAQSVVDMWCRLVAEGMPRIKGNLTFKGDVLYRFEIELEYNYPLSNDPRRINMLHVLEHKKIAPAAALRQLGMWPGKSDIGSHHAKHWTMERWLDVKVCIERQGAVFVKPYLGFAPVPRIGWNRNSTNDKIAE